VRPQNLFEEDHPSVWDFVAKQNASADKFLAAGEADKGDARNERALQRLRE
jgi:hypothetical protein